METLTMTYEVIANKYVAEISTKNRSIRSKECWIGLIGADFQVPYFNAQFIYWLADQHK